MGVPTAIKLRRSSRNLGSFRVRVSGFCIRGSCLSLILRYPFI